MSEGCTKDMVQEGQSPDGWEERSSRIQLQFYQACGLSSLNYLEHVLIEERESIHDPLVKPMQVRGIHLDQGSNEATGSMGPMFVVAVHPSQRAAHISPVNQQMIFHAFEDVAGRFESVAEPLNGRE